MDFTLKKNFLRVLTQTLQIITSFLLLTKGRNPLNFCFLEIANALTNWVSSLTANPLNLVSHLTDNPPILLLSICLVR